MEDDEKLKSLYSVTKPVDLENVFHKSSCAITQHANPLGLRSSIFFTQEDEKFIADNYLTMSDEDIGKQLRGKSRYVVKWKRDRMRLYHPKAVAKIGYENLSKYIRHHNIEWKRDSMKVCSYKCAISGGRFQDIHHLYGMNMILQQVINEMGIPEDFDVNAADKYTLERILCRFCALQGRYGAGVCLSHEIHMQFHTEYGFGNNTPEQFENFLKKHNYTLYVQQDIA